MKRVIVFLAALLLLSSCDSIRTGDLIFVGFRAESISENTSMTGAIAAATGRDSINYIHVGIIEVSNNSTWVLDANTSSGVSRRPLREFLREFYADSTSDPIIEIRRVKGESRAALRHYVENANRLLGLPYDYHFLPDNGQYYCSELVYDSYVRKDGSHIFHAAPMNFLNEDGVLSEYWAELFASLGEEVPQSVPGTNPQDLHSEAILSPVRLPAD